MCQLNLLWALPKRRGQGEFDVGSRRILASGGAGAFIFKSQRSGKEGECWAVLEDEAGPAEKGEEAWRGLGWGGLAVLGANMG